MISRHIVPVIVCVACGLTSFTGSSPAQQSETVCDSLAAPLSGIPGLVLSSRDTLATNYLKKWQRMPGCWLWFTGPYGFGDSRMPDAIMETELSKPGWELRQVADGPGSAFLAVRRGSLLCMTNATWDPGNDADSTYIPESRYSLVLSCFEESG